MSDESDILDAMKESAAALRDAGVRFALAGGIAVYARGGPATEHDVDMIVREEDVDRALEVLAEAGFRTERPPEGWLVKAFHENGALVDLIYAPNGKPEAVEGMLERSEPIEVYAINVPVMTVADVLATKLLALKEHEVDYDSVLEVARTCREQVDWKLLRKQTNESPYANAFFTLVDELGISS
jgi:predicted nucleotidyltransferase